MRAADDLAALTKHVKAATTPSRAANTMMYSTAVCPDLSLRMAMCGVVYHKTRPPNVMFKVIRDLKAAAKK